MATRNSGWKLTEQDRVDQIDMIALVAFPVVAGLVYGIWTFQLDIVEFALTDVAFELGGYAFDWATIIALLSIGWVVGTNQIDGSDYEQWEYAVIVFAFLSVPLYEFVPAFANYVDAEPWFAFGIWLLASGAAVYVSWTE